MDNIILHFMVSYTQAGVEDKMSMKMSSQTVTADQSGLPKTLK